MHPTYSLFPIIMSSNQIFSEERLLFTPSKSQSNAIPIIYAFPNDYNIGITSLGYQIIWASLATRNDLQVSRLFTDIYEQLPNNPQLVGFSVSWELDYINILNLLEFLKIPLRSKDRQNEHPIIFGGGAVLTANPEPFADFFDVILLGDGENLIPNFIDTYQEVRGCDRSTKLQKLAQVPGIYVPSLYQVEYEELTGEIKSINPVNNDVPETVQKQTYQGNILSTSSVVTKNSAWPDIYMIEVVRSCPEMCRFCLASYVTLPFRTANLQSSLIPAIETGLKVTNRIGLLGASVTQHPEFDQLLDYLSQSQYDHVKLSVSSVRTNTVTVKLAEILAKRDTKSITIAVESGSEKMRKMINKKLENDEIIQCAINAKKGGLTALKLYGMVGLPGEEMEDLEQTVMMMKNIKKTVPGLRLTLGCSTFVPKAHTPFQWIGVHKEGEKRLQFLSKELKSKGMNFRPESYNWSVIQALISRGDRRLSYILELTRKYGDSLGSYRRAFKDLKTQLPPLDFYVFQNWHQEQILPWYHLKTSISEDMLKKHYLGSMLLINN